MGLLGTIKSGFKKVGGLAQKVAPYVGLIPGVGTVAGGAIGGLGALAAGKNIGEALKSGAAGALSGYGNISRLGGGGIKSILSGGLKKVGGNLGTLATGGRLGGSSGIPSFPGSGMPQPDLSALPGATGAIDAKIGGFNLPGGWEDVAKMGGGVLGGLGSGIGFDGGGGGGLLGGLRKVGSGLVDGAARDGGSWLDKLGGIGGLVDAGLGGASLYGGIQASNKAQGYRDKALGLAEGNWNDRAQLRKLSLAGLQNNTPQDLSSLFAASQSNPFARRVP